MSGLGAEIIAIEDTDTVGWVECATTIGEVTFQNIQTFVHNVLCELGTRSLSLLHIQVHGNEHGVQFGPSWVTINNFGTHQPTLSRLGPKFAGGAWVDLRACDAGQNLPLLRLFHSLWNVGIVAGRGRQSNLIDANLGNYQVITPSGHEYQSVMAPPF
ncbi:MAG: hypothetical protein V3R98_01800, partial [Alphaproteobacteria bacterium]